MMSREVNNLSKEEKIFFALLSACVKNTSFSETSITVETWEKVISLGREHNVLALVFEKASKNKSFTALEEYPQLVFETMMIVSGQARRTKAFLSIYKEFLKVNIHPIVMKGLICRQFYGEYCDHRPSGDEDILIHKSEYEQVKRILIVNGYIPENKNITAAQLDDLQEITFYNGQRGLSIEVHVNPIGREDKLRRQLNDCFLNIFQNCREEVIGDVAITTMGHTEHLLFLILHAFKHLTIGGFGIRQVLDILLYVENFGAECDWTYLYNILSQLKADSFFTDLLYIGNQYLGFDIELPSKPNCPEELLVEILDSGVFGNGTQAQRTAVYMTSVTIRDKDNAKQSKLRTLLCTIFPDKAYMLSLHPELQEKTWLLPIYWVKRWGRFIAHNKDNGGNLAVESMKISKRRIELLKKYDILP